MVKVKINIKYEYVGEEVGSVPFINVMYINSDNEELDAIQTLQNRRLSHVIPNSRYFYGKTKDGKKFKSDHIPSDAIYPVHAHPYEYYDIQDYKFNDVEMIVKRLATESNEEGISYYYYNDNGDGGFLGNSTTNLYVPTLVG